MKHTETITLQGSIADMRKRIAAEQASMHKVRLGVARWRNNPTQQEADVPPSPVSQTHWHAEAQCHFMGWLERGGFAHADADVSTPAMADTPPDISPNASSTAAAPVRQAALPVHCNGCAA